MRRSKFFFCASGKLQKKYLSGRLTKIFKPATELARAAKARYLCARLSHGGNIDSGVRFLERKNDIEPKCSFICYEEF